ncbi:MAG: glycosyltransferase [Rubellimicrobium sp.]|nr:glycosyltransferase [Rubellimicrobium sp.]
MMATRAAQPATRIHAAPDRLAAATVDPLADPADIDLIRMVGAGLCLRHGLLPWRRSGGTVLVLAEDGAALAGQAAALAPLGRVRHIPCPAALVRAGLRRAAAPLLVAEAETRTPPAFSCRSLPLQALRGPVMVVAVLALAVLLAPAATGAMAVTVAAIVVAANALLRLAALVASRVRPAPAPDGDAPLAPARLPVISLLVPLFHEREVAAHLLARLERLDYPRDRLDLCLILEDGDDLTRAALDAATLPDHAQVIEVPAGTIRTKPRALNFALNFARGSIIGIYDAEDRPDPGQLLQVARHFARAEPRVACLQGVLDYDNHRSNWIARCFTLEYAAWFRVILPGLQRMGLAIPLGGTTLFLRRHAIEDVGGWDAHNVTEDADLGIRLFRCGYRTEMLASATGEEANARVWPWIRQRTRWLKGYALTWAVHMRDPVRLWRDLGPWRFLGLQIVLLGTVTQFLLAPVVLSFWLLPLFGQAPFAGIWAWLLLSIFLLAEGVNAVAAGLGAIRAGKARLIAAIPLLHLYFPMASVAAWRALSQVFDAPFHWEKTAHGIFEIPAQPDGGTGGGAVGDTPSASSFSRVMKAREI